MFKKYATLTGIIIALVFLVIATLHYPGGEQFDKKSVGYSWTKNYFCNLVNPIAVNGTVNTARPWMVCFLICMCVTLGFFFGQVSKKMPTKGAAGIVKYSGVAAIVFILLIVTPYHDTGITLASFCVLLSVFYITVFSFKSRRFFISALSGICMLSLYCGIYMYFTQSGLVWLPVVQKACLFILIAWVLYLAHFTTAADFQPKAKQHK